jgi:Pentapeptide repeats (8 copies)
MEQGIVAISQSSANVRCAYSQPISYLPGSTKEFKFPPIDFSDRNRCVLQGSNMGQSNAARDKLYDLRQCQLSGADASGLDLSGVIMSKTDVSKAKFLESYFSKAYLRGACFLCLVASVSSPYMVCTVS